MDNSVYYQTDQDFEKDKAALTAGLIDDKVQSRRTKD